MIFIAFILFQSANTAIESEMKIDNKWLTRDSFFSLHNWFTALISRSLWFVFTYFSSYCEWRKCFNYDCFVFIDHIYSAVWLIRFFLWVPKFPSEWKWTNITSTQDANKISLKHSGYDVYFFDFCPTGDVTWDALEIAGWQIIIKS